MVKRAVLAILFLALPSGQTAPQKPKIVSNGFFKAHEFLDLNETQKVAFAMGFLDGIFIAPLLDAPDDGKFYVSLRTCTAEMSGAQVAAIIEKYIRENPEDWHLQLHMVAFNSLLTACHAT
jgi:ABC-type multidrug transport system permease subunit